MNYENAQKEFIKSINKMSYSYATWEVFADFCRLAAIALYQPFRKSEKLEKEYLSIIKKYNKETANMFPMLLSFTIEALSDKFGDFLGECFMELNLGSKYKGQYFTPYCISKFMSSILGNDLSDVENFCEPTCGSGGMIIARADILREKGINYQQTMQVQAIDVDSLCFCMSYIQLTLLNIKANVIHGNSLSLEVYSSWYTPAYIINSLLLKSDKSNSIELPNDNIDNEIIKAPKEIFSYTQEQIQTFKKGRLF